MCSCVRCPGKKSITELEFPSVVFYAFLLSTYFPVSTSQSCSSNSKHQCSETMHTCHLGAANTITIRSLVMCEICAVAGLRAARDATIHNRCFYVTRLATKACIWVSCENGKMSNYALFSHCPV